MATQLLQVHDHTLSIQHHMDAAITGAAAPGRDLTHGFPNGRIVGSNAAISHARPIHGQDCTRPALTYIMLFADMGHHIRPCAGCHH